MSRVLGAGVIGAGVIFSDHARAYAGLADRIRLVGLADVDEAKLRRLSGDFFVPFTTTDYTELLQRNDVDVVSICSPPCWHEEMVKAALEAGKYVICEKPLAQNLAAADRIVEHAARYPGKLSTVFQYRYAHDTQRVLWCRDEGAIGELNFGRFERQGALQAQQKATRWWGSWDVAGGGALMTQCIHELDQILLFFGPVRHVSAAMATLLEDIESEDTFAATITHESGAVTQISSSLAGNIPVAIDWKVIGDNGELRRRGAFSSCNGSKQRKVRSELARRFPPTGPKLFLPGTAGKAVYLALRKLKLKKAANFNLHLPYFQDIIGAIHDGRPLPIGPESARQRIELCTAIYTAALTGRRVELPLDRSEQFYNGITAADYNGRKQREAHLGTPNGR